MEELMSIVDGFDNLDTDIQESKAFFDIIRSETDDTEINPEYAVIAYRRIQTLHSVFFKYICNIEDTYKTLFNRLFKTVTALTEAAGK